jgi:hypothetical protein
MGVPIIAQGIGYDAMFKQIIKALIDVVGDTSTEFYAIFIVNSSLRKLDGAYPFLKNMKVDAAASEEELYHIIIISNDINSVSETDVRHAIHKLLEVIMSFLGEKARTEFIRKFKDALEKKYLSKIEEIGVNFHMIELHQEMGTNTEQQYYESKKSLVGVYS